MSTGETPQHGRVALIDNHVLFTDSLALALSRETYDVRTIPVPQSPNAADELVAATLRLGPAVVLLEIDLGRFGNGSRIIEPITSAGPAIVAVTGSNDTARWGEAIEAGAATVLSKDAKLGDLTTAIGRVIDRQPVLTPRERDDWLGAWQAKRDQLTELESRLAQLTRREAVVLSKLMQGRAAREIAQTDGLSESTVRTHIKAILAKLEASSQVAAVASAYQAGWRAP